MPAEIGVYEGRKGQKRLKAIQRQINRINEEFSHDYEGSPEFLYLNNEIEWEGTSRLIFVLAQRNVNFKWSGMRDYGYIRLCRRWIDERGIKKVTSETAAAMTRDILPVDMCDELSEELAALEIL